VKCCDMTAGMLRHKVIIQRLLKTPDGSGGWTRDWSSVGVAHAYMRASGGSERYGSDRLNSEVRYKATIRWRDNIAANDRILFDGKAFNIRTVIDLEFRKQWLELDLEDGVAT